MLMRMFPIPFGLPGYWVSLAVGLVIATLGAWWPWTLPTALLVLVAGQARPAQLFPRARAISECPAIMGMPPLILAWRGAWAGLLTLSAVAAIWLWTAPEGVVTTLAPLLRATAYYHFLYNLFVPFVSDEMAELGASGRWQYYAVARGPAAVLWSAILAWLAVAVVAASTAQYVVLRKELAELDWPLPWVPLATFNLAVAIGGGLVGLLVLAFSFSPLRPNLDPDVARNVALFFVGAGQPVAFFLLAGISLTILDVLARLVRLRHRGR